MTPKKQAYAALANTLIHNLKRNNMEGFYCDSSADAVALAMDLMKDAKTVGMGGSETVRECGLLDAVKESEALHFIDRNQATTPEERRACYAETVCADYFLMSTNAITLDGELVNIDGNGNRLACLMQGPEHVLVITGMNKVVEDVESGIQRIGLAAAPPNAARLSRNTPCSQTGHCGDCHSKDCICGHIVVTRHSIHPGRIKVILVGEELGF